MVDDSSESQGDGEKSLVLRREPAVNVDIGNPCRPGRGGRHVIFGAHIKKFLALIDAVGGIGTSENDESKS